MDLKYIKTKENDTYSALGISQERQEELSDIFAKTMEQAVNEEKDLFWPVVETAKSLNSVEEVALMSFMVGRWVGENWADPEGEKIRTVVSEVLRDLGKVKDVPPIAKSNGKSDLPN